MRSAAIPALPAVFGPKRFPHPTAEVEVMETHISWIVLTGPFAYKLKKPVNFGFLDYSSLEARQRFCQEEVRLNGRLAPHLYLGVVPISRGADGALEFDGGGEPIDYAVKLEQFAQDGLFDHLAESGRLTGSHLDRLADHVAAFHREARQAPPDSRWGTPATVAHWTQENFEQLERLGHPAPDLQRWSAAALEELRPALQQRKAGGAIRECHGDLHLKNVVEHRGEVLVFDGIEFNPDFIWIDVLDEIAFLVMDLFHRGQRPLAWRFLNRYLRATGDYEGMALFRFYLVYRSVVRAKVAALSADPTGVREYLELARREALAGAPELVITHGLSGCGKSFQSRGKAEAEGWIHLQSDVERKRLFGLGPEGHSDSALGGGIYTGEATAQTYARLLQLADGLLRSGQRVIVDATFLRREQRQPFARLAASLRVAFGILAPPASPELLRERVAKRGSDASEANLAVLEAQLRQPGGLDEDEKQAVLPWVG